MVTSGEAAGVGRVASSLPEVVSAETLLLEPTVRPTTDEPRTREGLYVFRFFDVAHKDVDEIAEISLEAWEHFENVDRYRAIPQGLFRQHDTSAANGKMLLCTWYDGLPSWQESRTPPGPASERFRRPPHAHPRHDSLRHATARHLNRRRALSGRALSGALEFAAQTRCPVTKLAQNPAAFVKIKCSSRGGDGGARDKRRAADGRLGLQLSAAGGSVSALSEMRILSALRRTVASPMPFTRARSSGESNRPCASR